MRRMFQRRTVAGAFALFFLALLAGGWAYARSERASRLIADKMGTRLGMPVQLGSISFGVTSTTFKGLRLYERDAIVTASEPWVTVGEASLDISPVSAVAGRTPDTVTLSDAQVTLRFDQSGNLVTKLPAGDPGGPLPDIRIVSGVLTIKQEGHPDSRFDGIDLKICLDCGNPTVRGTVHDPAWGSWVIDGTLDAATQKGQATLKAAEPRRITPDLLKQTPFVSPSAWEAVRLEGMSDAQLVLNVDLASETMTYRLTMSPTQTSIDIPSVGMLFREADGGLVAEGSTLKLVNVRGKFADGSVKLNSDMQFAAAQDVLNFTADLADVDVTKLPDTWQIPDAIQGRLRAKINFSVTILGDGRVKTDGRGEGVLEQVKLNGVSVDPIHLSVRPSVKGGFKLSRQEMIPGDAIVRARFEEPQTLPVPKKEPPKKEAGKKVTEQATGLLSRILRGIADVVKPANAPQEEKAYLKLNISLTDVNVGDVLKSLNLTLPVRLGGKASLKLLTEIPTESPGEFAAYRFTGTLTSPRLTIEDLPVENVQLKLIMRDGKLSVRELTAKLPGADENAPLGLISGRGDITLEQDYPFSAQLQADKVALDRLDDLRELVPLDVQISGTAVADAKIEGTARPFMLKSNGTAKITDLKVGPITVGEVSSKWVADEKSLRLTDIRARLYKGELNGSLGIPFRSDVAAEGNLKLTKIDLAEVSRGLFLGGGPAMEGLADGSLVLKIPPAAEGAARPATAQVELRAPRLKLQNFPAEKIKVDARYAAGVVRYKLTGDALGGQFEVDGQYPPPPAKKAVPPPKKAAAPPKRLEDWPLGTVRLKGVQLSKILENNGLLNTLGPLDADIDGYFPLGADQEDNLVGTGTLRAARIRWGGESVALLGEGVLRLTPGEIRLEDFSIPVGNGLARVSATFDRAKIDRSRGTITFSNFPSDTIFFAFPDVAKRIKCKINGSVTTTLGREWRGSGVLVASQGTIYKIPVQEARFPLDWVASPAAGRGEFHIRDLVGTAARGRVTGRAELTFFPESDIRLAGELKFGNVNVSSIFRSAGGVLGSTPVSGTFAFSSDRLRTTDDIKANLIAKSAEATPFGLPVLSDAAPLMGFGPNANPPITSGELKTSLANGVWNIERLALTGPSLDLYADGTITTSGRLKLNVAGTPGRLDLSATLLSRLGTLASQVVTQPLNPAGFQQAVGIIGNFVVFLEVTGTTDQPKFRVLPIRTLTDAALRFFLLRYVPIP